MVDEVSMTCRHGNPIGNCLLQRTCGCPDWDALMDELLWLKQNAGQTAVHGTPEHLRYERLDALGLAKDVAHGPDWTTYKLTRKGSTWEPKT